jgi:hypothetical protein
MAPPRCIITAGTSPRELRRVFRASPDGTLPCVVDPAASRVDLERIAAAHRYERYRGALLQLLVAHPAADAEFLHAVLDAEDDAGVQSAVATSPQASRAVLERLAASGSPGARAHAALALLQMDLATAPPEVFEAALAHHVGDAGIDLGARALLVAHPRTPRVVLTRLAEDDADFIRHAAEARLGRSPRPGNPA